MQSERDRDCHVARQHEKGRLEGIQQPYEYEAEESSTEDGASGFPHVRLPGRTTSRDFR